MPLTMGESWVQIYPFNTMSPGLRPTSVPSGILIHPTNWPQYTNVTYQTDRQERQDYGPVAYGEPLLVMVAQKLLKIKKQ